MFACTPDVAEQQEWALVVEIAEWRAAKAAVEIYQRGAKGIDDLRKYPELAELLVDLVHAQGGVATTESVIGAMASRGGEEDSSGNRG